MDLANPRSPDALLAMGEYFAELSERFDGGFEPGNTLTADAEFFEAPSGAFVVVRSCEDPAEIVGCGGVRLLDERTAEIKRMWISKRSRGRGYGRLLLSTLEDYGSQLGAGMVRLDTNSVLQEAITMYESAGYEQIARYNDNPFAQRWFEKDLTQSK